jgi:hypothetical protein
VHYGLPEKINTLNRDTQTFKSILNEKDKLIQQLEKQKDSNIMTEPFLVKIQLRQCSILAVNLWSVTYFGVFNFGTSYLGAKIGQNKTMTKISRFTLLIIDKDEHISALMERLKTVSKGYEQHKIQHNDLMTMPESGYNTRMNEGQ